MFSFIFSYDGSLKNSSREIYEGESQSDRSIEQYNQNISGESSTFITTDNYPRNASPSDVEQNRISNSNFEEYNLREELLRSNNAVASQGGTRKNMVQSGAEVPNTIRIPSHQRQIYDDSDKLQSETTMLDNAAARASQLRGRQTIRGPYNSRDIRAGDNRQQHQGTEQIPVTSTQPVFQSYSNTQMVQMQSPYNISMSQFQPDPGYIQPGSNMKLQMSKPQSRVHQLSDSLNKQYNPRQQFRSPHAFPQAQLQLRAVKQNIYSGQPNIIQTNSPLQIQYAPYAVPTWDQSMLTLNHQIYPMHQTQHHPMTVLPGQIVNVQDSPQLMFYGINDDSITRQQNPSRTAVEARYPMSHRINISGMQVQTPSLAMSAAQESSAMLAPPPIPLASELRGNVHSHSKEQLGCRILQRIIEESNDEELIQIIFDECLPVLNLILIDSFGNYLFQKLFEYAGQDLRTKMLLLIQRDMFSASLNLHGTRSVQKIIDICYPNPEHVAIMSDALCHNTAKLCIDRNGNHVIQKCLCRFHCEENIFIFNAVVSACLDICTHRHGCCVVQRCLDACRDAQGIVQGHGLSIINEIIKCSVSLMQHQYGNYVVQYVIEGASQSNAIELISKKCSSELVGLSMQKFASNVIEKLLKKGKISYVNEGFDNEVIGFYLFLFSANVEVQIMLVNEMLPSHIVKQLLDDQYGNYVIQSAIEVLPPVAGLKLVEAIQPYISTISSTSGGRRIMAKLMKNYSLFLISSGIPMGQNESSHNY